MGLDLVCQYGSAPALRDVLRAIPVAQLGVVKLLDQLDDVAPGQLANGSLTDCVLIGHASANLRMYLRFADENPFAMGNSERRSMES